MATLADALRGYVPPTESPMSDVVTNYASNIIPQAQQNLQNQTNNIQNALTMTPDYHIQVGNQQAFNEFMNQVPNQAGMMIGPESKLWNQENAFKAAQMLKQGVPEADVFKATNTAKGLDNQFRQEISDYLSHIKGGPTFEDAVFNRMEALKKAPGEPMYAEDILYHPELYKAYPELKNVQIEFLPESTNNRASYNPVHNVISVNMALNPAEARSSMLHEMQHAVQEIEGFNKGADANKVIGASIKHYNDLMDEIGVLNDKMSSAVGTPEYEHLMSQRNALTKKALALGDPEQHGINTYKNYGGEAEARLTQNREDLPPEKLKQYFPFKQDEQNYGLDINPKEAIIDTESVKDMINRKQMLENLFNKAVK